MTDTTPSQVRVRFAPSPTGPLHIGGVRTALYNYLFAKNQGGKLLLRIEDTDSRRFVPGAEEYIIESLKWLGIHIDEGVGVGGEYGPYRQSERRDIYRKYVRELLDSGQAYKAYDTPEELEQARESTKNFQYDASTRMGMRNSLALTESECEELEQAGVPYVVRLRIEPGEAISFTDMVRGEVTINSSELDDKVLFKQSDDLPTYHLANVVDDHLMKISHVIRGEEWVTSTPLHVLLYRAFGWENEMPRFAHLPLLLKPEGSGKLSKRDGDKFGFPVFPLRWESPEDGAVSPGYRESGYLPEAVVNFLALLGWNPGDDIELMPMNVLIRRFDLSSVNKSGARFDYEKGKWFNQQYIRICDLDRLADLCKPYLEQAGITCDHHKLVCALELTRERLTLLPDVVEQTGYLLQAPTDFDEKSVKKRWKEDSAKQLTEYLEYIDTFSRPLDVKLLDEKTHGWLEEKGYKIGVVMNALRVALVGKAIGLYIYDIIDFIGVKETKQRVQYAIERLG
ncbi:glutamate--tRNA ligase [Porphyromonas bennonis]|uniref:glutamate--tRNA ligase n=1 Tax=Porphyromonas bennonis TaxID=501496 RepID=UPI000370D21E|nr:glutamate--tRNA ligase [Porphyromonas bennonis]